MVATLRKSWPTKQDNTNAYMCFVVTEISSESEPIGPKSEGRYSRGLLIGSFFVVELGMRFKSIKFRRANAADDVNVVHHLGGDIGGNAR